MTNVARIVGAIALAGAITWCVAAAKSIPTASDGAHTLVAVEPLLRSLQLAYVIQGTALQIAGRPYPQPLVERNGTGMADALVFARFLHLGLAKKNGVLVFSSPQSPDAAQSAPPPQADLDALRDELLNALNDHRRSIGRAPLHVDSIAEAAAQFQAQDMARAAAMRHEDSSGRSPMQRYAAMGGRAEWYAENVGWYGLDVWGKSALWSAVSKLDAEMMAEQPPDDGHRVNILSPNYDAIGIGVSVGPHGLYLAEDFSGS